MSSKSPSLLLLESSFLRLGQIVLSFDIPDPKKIWRPATARAFAEELILCPDEATAFALMRSRPEAAIAFVELFGVVLRQARSGETKPRSEPPTETTPFYHAAAFVLDYCKAILEVDPASYADA
jgi:hypothetical protein